MALRRCFNRLGSILPEFIQPDAVSHHSSLRNPGLHREILFRPLSLSTAFYRHNTMSSFSIGADDIEDVELEEEIKPRENPIAPKSTHLPYTGPRSKYYGTPQQVGHQMDPSLRTKYVKTVDIDIAGLRQLLYQIHAVNVCVVGIPPERNYVDYCVSLEGKSARHRIAMGDAIVKEYKQRYVELGSTLQLCGTDEWYIINLGNVVIHIMSEDERDRLELEKLWVLGPELDDQQKMLNTSFNTVYEHFLSPM